MTEQKTTTPARKPLELPPPPEPFRTKFPFPVPEELRAELCERLLDHHAPWTDLDCEEQAYGTYLTGYLPGWGWQMNYAVKALECLIYDLPEVRERYRQALVAIHSGLASKMRQFEALLEWGYRTWRYDPAIKEHFQPKKTSSPPPVADDTGTHEPGQVIPLIKQKHFPFPVPKEIAQQLDEHPGRTEPRWARYANPSHIQRPDYVPESNYVIEAFAMWAEKHKALASMLRKEADRGTADEEDALVTALENAFEDYYALCDWSYYVWKYDPCIAKYFQSNGDDSAPPVEAGPNVITRINGERLNISVNLSQSVGMTKSGKPQICNCVNHTLLEIDKGRVKQRNEKMMLLVWDDTQAEDPPD